MQNINKIHNVSVRLNDSEFTKLNILSNDLDVSKGTILRLNLHNARGGLQALQRRSNIYSSKRPTNDFKLLDKLNLLNQNLARTGNLVNQIARVANRTNSTTLTNNDVNNLKKLKCEIEDVKHDVRKLMNH